MEINQTNFFDKDFERLNDISENLLKMFLSQGLSTEQICYVASKINDNCLQMIKHPIDDDNSEQKELAKDIFYAIYDKVIEAGAKPIDFYMVCANICNANSLFLLKSVYEDTSVEKEQYCVYFKHMLEKQPLFEYILKKIGKL